MVELGTATDHARRRHHHPSGNPTLMIELGAARYELTMLGEDTVHQATRRFMTDRGTQSVIQLSS